MKGLRPLVLLVTVLTLCSCSGGEAPAPQKSVFSEQERAMERAKEADKMVKDAVSKQREQIEEQSN